MTTEYRKRPGLNYSLLAQFYRSQDHALLEPEPKSYFEYGHALELALQDVAQDTRLYHERFFNSDCPGSLPDKIVAWIKSGDDLTEKYTYNKNGDLNKKYSRIHGLLDECQKHPGKMPMCRDDQDLVGRMLNSVLKMEIEGVPFKEVLPDCMFQVPLYWEMQGIEKKALVDIIYQTADQTYLWDLKTAATVGHFRKMLRQRYWIQHCHYTEGARKFFKGVRSMSFIVASKSEDELFQAGEHEIDPTNKNELYDKYLSLVIRYNHWVEDGKPSKGWRDKEILIVYT